MVSPAAQLSLIQPSSAALRTLGVAAKTPSPAHQSHEEKNQAALREIESFLRALKSYPARFAEDPNMTFAEYCRCLISMD